MRKPVALSTVTLVGLLFILVVPPAIAHPGHSHVDGRVHGRPDFQRIGNVEIDFHPKAGAYTYTRANEPPIWFHGDPIAALEGAHYELPTSEEPIVCATSGHRIRIMYSTAADPFTPTPATAALIRSYVRRMSAKILRESVRSSNSARALRMRVDCEANGEIRIYSFPHSTGEPGSLFYWASQFFGSPSGSDSVKNLIFYDGIGPDPRYGGWGQYSDSSTKSSFDGPPFGNPNRYQTKSAVVYNRHWHKHTTLHELFHTMGAVQDQAPYSTFNGHCWTGIDVMCYDDDKDGEDRVGYTESFCPPADPPNAYYNTPIGTPLDCNYDTYFDAGEESGEWLNNNWNVGGAENPFLVEAPTPAKPTIATKNVTDFPGTPKITTATLRGTITPNGLETRYYFEYGLTDDFGSKVPFIEPLLSSNLYTAQSVSERTSVLKLGTTYHYRLVAINAKGTTIGPDQTFTTPTWEIQWGLENFEGANRSHLYDVSCEPSSTNLCTAVGKSTSSGVESPLVQRWDGTNYSLQTPAKKSGATHNRLFGVDCPSATRCIAVGSYQNSGSGSATLAELWNENKWSVQSTPIPPEATSSELVAVGCNSTATCTAVGSAVIGGVKTAIAEKWTSPTWALSPIPIPEGAKSSQLDGVDCIWSNFCVAVGRYTTSGGDTKSLAMFWNGSWSLQTLADPAGATQSTLLDVSCTPSPNVCTAVGGWKNSASDQFTLAYRFNGSSWTLQSTPNPVGSVASVFQDVSCATTASCTAVGSWVGDKGGSNRTLAENWNGSTWLVQDTPDPLGATFSAFFGTSCRAANCLAVGWSSNAAGEEKTLAEIYDPTGRPTIAANPASDLTRTSATLNGAITPNGLSSQYHFKYGLTNTYGTIVPVPDGLLGSDLFTAQPVSQVITGLQPGTTYHYRLVATNAKGTTESPDQTFTTSLWELQSTPNPLGASDSHLKDVNCEPSSTNFCTAVGFSTTSSGLEANPIAQRWNGTSWTEQTPALKSGATVTHLLGVDCPSATRCIAVGKSADSGGSSTALAELWNENKWSVQSTPVPSGSNSGELVAVGCNSTASCVAVGSAFIGGHMTAIAERWASPTWSLESIPIPSGANWSKLSGVDCIWSNFCVAVGSYAVSGGWGKSYAIFWNGTNWSLQTLPVPEGIYQSTLLDVSCTPSPSRCTAVGWWTNNPQNQFTLAYRFDGSTWTLQSTPNPTGSIQSFFEDVSCATETSCTAVGGWLNSGSGLTTLAETWNGSSWSVEPTANPSGSVFSILSGTSCRGTSCIGVGTSADATGEVETTLAQIRP